MVHLFIKSLIPIANWDQYGRRVGRIVVLCTDLVDLLYDVLGQSYIRLMDGFESNNLPVVVSYGGEYLARPGVHCCATVC